MARGNHGVKIPISRICCSEFGEKKVVGFNFVLCYQICDKHEKHHFFLKDSNLVAS